MTSIMSRQGTKRLIGTALLIALAAPTVALAQDKDDKAAQGTAALNRQQASAAAAQNEANRTDSAAFVQNVEAYEAERTAVAQARADYEARMEQHRRQQAEYDAAYARWQQDVIACRNGDRSRCGVAAPSPK